jgi:peptide/nickel transport system ATP-binding protein
MVGRPLKAPEQKNSELPDPLNPPPGCAFAGRCPRAREKCSAEDPTLTQLEDGRLVACHYPIDR